MRPSGPAGVLGLGPGAEVGALQCLVLDPKKGSGRTGYWWDVADGGWGAEALALPRPSPVGGGYCGQSVAWPSVQRPLGSAGVCFPSPAVSCVAGVSALPLRGRVSQGSGQTWGPWGAGLVMALPCYILRLTREPVAESPKKKRWEAPSSLHPPRGAGSAPRGGGAQSQRGTPGAGGAGRARGSSFAKFGNRNVFMKDNSSSSSTDSRSRSSSRSPTRHFRRRCEGSGDSGGGGAEDGPLLTSYCFCSDSHSDSDTSDSGTECRPVGRRNPPPKGRGGRGAHMDRGRGRAQRGKR